MPIATASLAVAVRLALRHVPTKNGGVQNLTGPKQPKTLRTRLCSQGLVLVAVGPIGGCT
eukprot:4889327-Amphidinium_carterae.1